ncbi:alpha/beta-hydrolase [Armillaria solidipes]|uniref:Alpha/beta-hydrolase n=1 Tax=Armillaria solidipes TaxID=1076256 RepID=A0A2H3B404_9AGAR|nr:alpha/beta-hydrolase [Armillaria solidipes]
MSGQFITSQDGTHIWADAAGTPGKPSVVFVHGFLTSSLNWTRQFGDRQLLESLYIIKYETRGHGRSDQPESEDAYVSARHAEDFQAVCTTFGVTKPVVVGWSLGGIIVPDILSRFGTSPLPVAGLIMFNAIPWRSMFPEILTPYSTNILPPLSSPELPDFQNALQELISAFFSPGYIAKVSFEERCAWIGSAASMNTAARTFSISRTQDETALLSVSKELPILCIQATGDKLMEQDKHEAFMKRHFGNNLDYRRIPGGGHAPFYEFPENVNSMIIEFIQRVYDIGVDTGL